MGEIVVGPFMLLVCGMVMIATSAAATAKDAGTSFFVTSKGPGDGGNLGGLAGADKHCQKLAEAAGAGRETWQAYLSSSTANARDRVGNGPWHNVKGELIARNIDELHSEGNNITKQSALSETGETIQGMRERPNRHDILTGSKPDGTAAAGMSCSDWTSNGGGHAMVGHHDRIGLRDDGPSRSWNSSHPTRGCSQEALRFDGGDGLFYCFAIGNSPPAQATPELSVQVPRSIAELCGTIIQVANQWSLPASFFVRLIWQESRFDAAAVSPKGAQGIAQFLPGTARERGLTNPYSPVDALRASAHFLSDLRIAFGNLGLAAAAYNAGPTGIRDWLGGRRSLPLETQDYVFKITGKSAAAWTTSGDEYPPELSDSRQMCLRLASRAAPIVKAQIVEIAGQRKDPGD